MAVKGRGVYPLLRELVQNRNLTVADLASKCKCTSMSVQNKFNGKTAFTVDEAIAIKEVLNTDETIENLFKRD